MGAFTVFYDFAVIVVVVIIIVLLSPLQPKVKQICFVSVLTSYVRIKRFLNLGSITVADALQLAVGWNSPTSGSQADVRENLSASSAASSPAPRLETPSALSSPISGDQAEDTMPTVGRIEFKPDDSALTIHTQAAGDRDQIDEIEHFHSPLAAASSGKLRRASDSPPPS